MMITVEKVVGAGGSGIIAGAASGDGSPARRVDKHELNKAYKMMLHQRRDAVSGQSGDEAILRSTSPATKGGTNSSMGLTLASEDEQKQRKEHVNGNEKLQRNADEKCMPKCRGPKKEGAVPAKKWSSALRVVAAMTRFKNIPKRHHQQLNGDQQQRQAPDECSRGSSFSSESAPAGRNGAAAIAGAGLGGGGSGSSTEHDPDNIDPVYLALKQATEKYGTPAGSRRGSQNVVTMMVDSSTPSPRDLSQTSLQDSGTYSGNEYCGAGALLRHHPPFATGGGSTPQLHGISVGKGSSVGISGNSDCVNSTNCQQPLSSGGRRPKLSEKMKSLSLDCAEMPDPVQNGMANRQQQYKSKPIRSARGGLASVQQSFDKSASPNGRQQTGPLGAIQLVPHKQRRLPPVPSAAPQAVIVPQQQHHNNNNSNIMHIIIHEYSSADCVLRPGDRVVVVDNGDPDWKHGFKFNDCLEHLLTFPSSCVAAYHMEEQPMKLLQSCNLVEQKIRLYRDQIVFAQPNGLSEDGRLLLVRNEHSKLAHCPLHFLTLT